MKKRKFSGKKKKLIQIAIKNKKIEIPFVVGRRDSARISDVSLGTGTK